MLHWDVPFTSWLILIFAVAVAAWLSAHLKI
jgi:hypothetical protein